MYRPIWRQQRHFTFGTLYKWETWAHRTLLPNFLPFTPFLITHTSPPHPTLFLGTSPGHSWGTDSLLQVPLNLPVIPVTGSTEDFSAVQEQGLVCCMRKAQGPGGCCRGRQGRHTAKWRWPLSVPGLPFFFFSVASSAELLGALCKHCCSKWLNSLDI